MDTYEQCKTKNAAKELQERNFKWRNSYSSSFFQDLAKGQSPDVLFISCSDSRVTPAVISQSNLGEIFEFRNIANVTLPTDINIKALLCYALLHLHIKHVVVCGHYHCGGVNAAMKVVEEGYELEAELATHLGPIIDTYKENKDVLSMIKAPHQRHQRLVELNVNQQVANLRSLPFVQNMGNEEGIELPMFHGAVFDVGTGELKTVSQPTSTEIASHLKVRLNSELSRLSYFATSYNPFNFIGAADKHNAIKVALEKIDNDETLLQAVKQPDSELYLALNQKRILPITFMSFSQGFSIQAKSLHHVKELLPQENSLPINTCCTL